MKLYHGITSVCSIKVRLGLAEIGLAYESAVLNLPAGDQHDPEYLKLNPNGVVPTLVDDGLILTESSLILEYLDREHNQSKLMPRERALEATARHWLLRCIAVHDAINTMTFATVNRDKALATKTPEQIAASLSRMPNPVMRMKRKDLYEHGISSGYMDQALVTLGRTFNDMSDALHRQKWISGPDFGLSDIALLAYIDRLERLGFEGLWTGSHASIAEWLSTMQARPSYTAEVSGKIPSDTAAAMRAEGEKFWPRLRDRI